MKIKIAKELLRPKIRHPVKPSKRMKDKTKYTRKDKHKDARNRSKASKINV